MQEKKSGLYATMWNQQLCSELKESVKKNLLKSSANPK